jgi:flagellar motility protein MotE (MotC chaperone)|uniref:Magnesium transporter MgtE intracellular domain-containing protein n=1 Tax=Thermodesulfobacterium geofontis TaxID=1295609 RepID=A0A7V5K1P2_9BACT
MYRISKFKINFKVRIKNLFWFLMFLGVTKFILVTGLIFSEVNRVSAKEGSALAGCPPEFFEVLDLERAKLFEKAKEIELREKELELMEKRIREQMAALKDLEATVDQKLSKLETIQDERTKLLARAISEMRAGKAAEILINMDKDMAVKILSQLKSQQIASILSAMPPDKAANLSSALSGYPPKEY